MSILFLLALLSAIIVLPSLLFGAISDIRTRKFPKAYWKYTAPLAGLVTILMYLMLISDGQYFYAMYIAVPSVAIAFAALFMGYRFGSGGDWLAVAYVSVLCPAFILSTCFFGMIVALIQSAYAVYRRDDLDPFQFRSIPFAVAILVGFCISLVVTIPFNL